MQGILEGGLRRVGGWGFLEERVEKERKVFIKKSYKEKKVTYTYYYTTLWSKSNQTTKKFRRTAFIRLANGRKNNGTK